MDRNHIEVISLTTKMIKLKHLEKSNTSTFKVNKILRVVITR